MMNEELYTPDYDISYALIIGINSYQNAPTLNYAVNDAEAIAKLLTDEFDFKKNNVLLIKDEEATKNVLMHSFLDYSCKTSNNDRILFFFAGHGHTEYGHRGEVGFLVPHDGNPKNLSTLIRWDELTKGSELIPAKHILFIMDACYGGLILGRSLPPGSMRFLKDMLRRYSRQAITAGKADEVVSDSGGPIPEHSIFTGHFIEGLKGKAATENGIITANGIMSYVYEKVSKDQNSHQTPHFGFLDGDGDFVFRMPVINDALKEEKKEQDLLVSIPSTMPMENENKIEEKNIIDIVKEYLSDSRYTIKLDDLIVQKIREFLLLTSEDNFKLQGVSYSPEEFLSRLTRYEHITNDLLSIASCIAFWGTDTYHQTLKRTLTRLTDRLTTNSGVTIWNKLRWYPVMLIMYSAGISALAAGRYDNLAAILLSKIESDNSYDFPPELTLAAEDAVHGLSDFFKQIPGHERQYTPKSEYLFKLLQPTLDDLLFLGRDYENYFDKFEVFIALTYADLNMKKKNGRFWCPVGRFAWKTSYSKNPMMDIIKDALKDKDSWKPLKAGLFSGEYSHFEHLANQLPEFVDRLGYF